MYYVVLSLVMALTAALSPLRDASQQILKIGEYSNSIRGPVMDHNFPDPTVLHYNGIWYAYATNNPPNPHPHVQMATSPDFVHWTLSSIDPLLQTGAWTVGNQTWAPSVIQRSDGKWVLFYTNPTTEDPAKHCVGVALASLVGGPYTPVGDTPFICPLAQGGAIDPAVFRDRDGSVWLVWKVDGNSLGHGGACSNGVPPIAPTPIMVQRLSSSMTSFEGSATQILTNEQPQDGPNVEAPNLVRSAEGVYFLFYSSNCFTTPLYDVAYATASNITGPYTRRGSLLQTGDYGLTAPGGATVDADAQHLVFHADCEQGRCMYTGRVVLNGTTASIAQ